MTLFGKRIKELREENGLTQDEIARDFHTNRQAISRWELGTSEPAFDIVVKFADYFKVTIDYLFGLQD